MLAVYTCFFGNDKNWSNVVLEPLKGFDSYYFTNNPKTYESLALTRWKRVWVNIPVSDDMIECARQSKHLRCCPWDVPELKAYPYLCWVDSKLRMNDWDAVMESVTKLVLSDKVWLFTQHPRQYTDVWGEYHEAIQHEKYARQKAQYKAYITSRLDAGYTIDKPIRVCCGFSIRKRCPLAKEIGEFWYQEIQECGIEDQISFQFVHQRYEDAILVVPYQTGWSYI